MARHIYRWCEVRTTRPPPPPPPPPRTAPLLACVARADELCLLCPPALSRQGPRSCPDQGPKSASRDRLRLGRCGAKRPSRATPLLRPLLLLLLVCCCCPRSDKVHSRNITKLALLPSNTTCAASCRVAITPTRYFPLLPPSLYHYSLNPRHLRPPVRSLSIPRVCVRRTKTCRHSALSLPASSDRRPCSSCVSKSHALGEALFLHGVLPQGHPEHPMRDLQARTAD